MSPRDAAGEGVRGSLFTRKARTPDSVRSRNNAYAVTLPAMCSRARRNNLCGSRLDPHMDGEPAEVVESVVKFAGLLGNLLAHRHCQQGVSTALKRHVAAVFADRTRI